MSSVGECRDNFFSHNNVFLRGPYVPLGGGGQIASQGGPYEIF